MFDTNALLSIAFAMISNFTHVVDIPADWVPKQSSDLRFCMIGGPVSPVEVNMIHHSGTQFWIRYGVVRGYASPQSFFRSQDPARLAQFTGETRLSSNDVVRIASNVLKPLIRQGDPLNAGPVRIRQGGLFQGKRIPFFAVTWPQEGSGGDPSASVEIDGRNGRIVAMRLASPCFYDLAFEDQWKRKVTAPEQPKPVRRPDHLSFPKPTTEYVNGAIGNWLHFCENLGLPYTPEAPADVDWENTFVYPQKPGPSKAMRCWIQFKNGQGFDSIEGFAYSHHAMDAAFLANGATKELNPRQTGARFNWKDLAKNLEAVMCSQHNGLDKTFAIVQPKVWNTIPLGSDENAQRVRVIWSFRGLEPFRDRLSEELSCFMKAEFDLQTGDVKSLVVNLGAFPDLGLLRKLGKASAISSRATSKHEMQP